MKQTLLLNQRPDENRSGMIKKHTDHGDPLQAGSADTVIRFVYMNQSRQLLLVSTFLNTGTPLLASSDWCRIHFVFFTVINSVFTRYRYQILIFLGQADTPELDYLFSNTYLYGIGDDKPPILLSGTLFLLSAATFFTVKNHFPYCS